jgi:hypothetical protein
MRNHWELLRWRQSKWRNWLDNRWGTRSPILTEMYVYLGISIEKREKNLFCEVDRMTHALSRDMTLS